MRSLKLGILDFGLGTPTRNGLLRIQDVVDYAIRADELGFSRFWLAEHHFSNPLLAWSDPTVLMPILAMATRHIRIGTGGLLLRYHKPYRVAITFKLLNNLFNNRIDLGLANGASYNTYAEQTRNVPASFDEKYRQLIHLLREEDTCFEQGELVIPPYKGNIPELWSLSSSPMGMERALALQTNFVRSIFHSGADLCPHRDSLEDFRKRYKARHHQEPQVILAVSGTCQLSESRARAIAEGLSLDPKLHLIGDREQVHEKLWKLSDEFGVKEFIWKDIGKNLEDKLSSLDNLQPLMHQYTPNTSYESA